MLRRSLNLITCKFYWMHWTKKYVLLFALKTWSDIWSPFNSKWVAYEPRMCRGEAWLIDYRFPFWSCGKESIEKMFVANTLFIDSFPWVYMADQSLYRTARYATALVVQVKSHQKYDELPYGVRWNPVLWTLKGNRFHSLLSTVFRPFTRRVLRLFNSAQM